MDLLTYTSDVGRRRQLADALGKSPDYLYQLGTNWNGKRPSPELARDIERATAEIGPERVRVESMLPELTWTRDHAGEVTGYHVPLTSAVA